LTPHRPHCTGEESLADASVHGLLEAAVPAEIDAGRLRYVMIASDPGRAADIARIIIDGGYPRARNLTTGRCNSDKVLRHAVTGCRIERSCGRA